jgi:hypothetical protein
MARLCRNRKLTAEEQNEFESKFCGHNKELEVLFTNAAAEEVGFKQISLLNMAKVCHLYPIPITSAEQASHIKGFGKTAIKMLTDFFEGKGETSGEHEPEEEEQQLEGWKADALKILQADSTHDDGITVKSILSKLEHEVLQLHPYNQQRQAHGGEAAAGVD